MQEGCRNCGRLQSLYLHNRDEKGNLRLVLIKRSNHGQHGSQISLPGGNREPRDEGAWGTALREIIEELGLSTKQIVLLSQIEPIDTHVTRYRVLLTPTENGANSAN
ncbi:NUDIX domain-containing protein [Pseudarthrobacter phenanthrenivorans]|uniref:NUDIX domain-containing protein n=1 Tax=Pseudarthrobacter phenanthrenivorans TaxID=361575 RepID=A0A3B0EXW6_PSEPS|nr:NUDIX domain-containing protein [Pseudarthrobacter phenanthrenivorans]RKO19626.1 NUDIX domain-containing protein [Pseudarthrobacter phenanthrenivorans]